MASRIALIIGYGPRVGAQVAQTFAAKGYGVAIVSRSVNASGTKNYLCLQADLSAPSTVENVFKTVIEKLGHPSVVVYNGSCFSPQSVVFVSSLSNSKILQHLVATWRTMIRLQTTYLPFRLATMSISYPPMLRRAWQLNPSRV